jgi:hypothetical protein
MSKIDLYKGAKRETDYVTAMASLSLEANATVITTTTSSGSSPLKDFFFGTDSCHRFIGGKLLCNEYQRAK